MTRRAYDSLSPAETRVLALLATGLTNRAMATRLGVSIHTVRSHVTHIYEQLDVHSRVDAALAAQRLGVAQ